MVGSRDEAVNAYGEWLEVLLGHREATSTPAVLRWLARLTVDELENGRILIVDFVIALDTCIISKAGQQFVIARV